MIETAPEPPATEKSNATLHAHNSSLVTGHSSLASRIESHLLEAHGWVSAADLAVTFGIGERALRAIDGKPGLCSEFAISGNKGFKHVQYATDAEFTRADQRVRKHAIGELIGARLRRRYRNRLLAEKPAPLHEKATGQGVMAL